MTDAAEPATTPPASPEAPPPVDAPAPVPRARRARLFWWVSLAVIAADPASKAIVTAASPLFDSVQVIPDLVSLVHVQNVGVAFGLLTGLDGAYRGPVTLGLALLALAGITYYARHLRPEERLARLGLSLILGGALGNLVDRIRLGYVLDFVDIYWRDWHFWAFNVADASITIGAILVFADLLVVSRHASDPV